jgi:hypothetical protein
MLEVSGWPQICSGLCPLRRVAGTPLAQAEALKTARYRLLVSLFRLLAGTHIPYGSENTAWVNGGTNPRDTKEFPGEEHIAAEVAARRTELQEAGWQVS